MNIKIWLVSLLFSFSIQNLTSQNNPIDVLRDNDMNEFVPLSDYRSTHLDALLKNTLNSNKSWKRLVTNKKLAVGIVDLQDVDEIMFACINCDHMMYSASLPKIAILLTAMYAFENQILTETPEITKDLNLMIRKSDNKASTRMIDRLGFELIEEVLTNEEYCLYDYSKGGGLWVGKRYASQGKRNPDPLMGLSHAATVRQICRFYYLMVRGELINEERSKQMMEIMTNPGIRHKFVHSLRRIAPKAKLFRKSGTWKTYHSDSILVWGPNGKQYIMAALVNDPNGESIIRELAVLLDKIINEL